VRRVRRSVPLENGKFDTVVGPRRSVWGKFKYNEKTTATLRQVHEDVRCLRKEWPELQNRNFLVLVTNEDGEEIGRVLIDTVH